MPSVSNRVSPWFLLLIVVSVGGAALTAVATDGSTVLLIAGTVLLVLGGWAVSLCLHEFGHAIVAYRGGDRSVRDKGYLTLDIRRYTDVGYSLVLPLIFLLLGGIPLPGGAVWINHGALRSRAVRSAVSLAGPAVNLVLAVLLTLAVSTVAMPPELTVGLSCLALIQVVAFVLNMLPVPGLDGFGALEPYLSPAARQFTDRVRPWGPIVLFVVLIGVPGVAQAFFALAAVVFDGIGGDDFLAALGYDRLLFWR